MKKFSSIFALVLAFAMLISVVPVSAATGYGYMFQSNASAYGTDIEYIDDLGIYVTGGKGFYSSTDGINWTMRAGGIADMKAEITGFAYGGPEGSEYILMIGGANTSNPHRVFSLDKYLSERNIIYNFTQDTSTGEAVDSKLVLRGVIEWDKTNKKFWCGATDTDGKNAGLYYTDGVLVGNKLYWTKADTGVNALYTTDTVFAAKAAVLSNITFDSKGRVVAYGMWGNKIDKNTLKPAGVTSLTATGDYSCYSAILVDTTTAAYSTKTLDFGTKTSKSTANGTIIPYVGMDKNGNIILQNATQSALKFAYVTFDQAFAAGDSGAEVSITAQIENSKYDNWNTSNNNTGVLGKIVNTKDNLLLIPRAGEGLNPAKPGRPNDIYVVSYKENGQPQLRYTTLLNDATTATSVLGDYFSDKTVRYIADAICADGEKVLLLRGKSEKTIATAPAYNTVISVIDLKNDAIDSTTDGTTTDADEDGNADDPVDNRSSKVSFAKTAEIDYSVSHIGVPDRDDDHVADTVFEVQCSSDVNGNVIPLNAVAYDGTTVASTVSQTTGTNADRATYEEDVDIGYKLVSTTLPDKRYLDFAEAEYGGNAYVFPNCDPGSYEVVVDAFLVDNPAVSKRITYTLNIVGKFKITVNGETNYQAQSSVRYGGLKVGKNVLSATCYAEGAEDCLAVMVVYRGENVAVLKSTFGPTIGIGSFTIQEDVDPAEYEYRVFFWDAKTLKPL